MYSVSLRASHFYSKVAKVPKFRYASTESFRSLVLWIRTVEGRVDFVFFFLAGVVFVCDTVSYGAFGYVNVCRVPTCEMIGRTWCDAVAYVASLPSSSKLHAW